MLSTLGLVLRNVRDDSNGERRLDFLMTGPDVFLSEDLRRFYKSFNGRQGNGHLELNNNERMKKRT